MAKWRNSNWVSPREDRVLVEVIIELQISGCGVWLHDGVILPYTTVASRRHVNVEEKKETSLAILVTQIFGVLYQ